MSVVRFSCPQLLDVALRAPQHPVDQESVGVGRYLRRDPGSQPDERGGQSLAQTKDSLKTRKSDLSMCCLTPRRSARSVAREGCPPRPGPPSAPRCCRLGLCQEPPRDPVSQIRLGDEFLRQADVRDIGGGQLVGDGHPVGRAQQVQLHTIDAEGAPPYPLPTPLRGTPPTA